VTSRPPTPDFSRAIRHASAQRLRVIGLAFAEVKDQPVDREEFSLVGSQQLDHSVAKPFYKSKAAGIPSG